MSVKKYGWAIQKGLFALTNQDCTFSQTRDNSKIFKATSKYFSFFNKKPCANWVAHMTNDFLKCYSCSYYISINIDLHLAPSHWLTYKFSNKYERMHPVDKKSLRHLRIVLKFSYLYKTFIRCLQGNWAATNCKGA